MQKRIVVLTGAGISAESGISTFRDSGGLWEQHDIRDVATPGGYARNPELVLEFYNQRRRQLKKANPNAGHRALCDLEGGYRVDIVTQNVDDLHERAGSTRVLHLHGELRKARSSIDPELVYDLDWKDIRLGETCELGGQLRPHIVWFGEPVPMMLDAARLASRADIFMVVGTSLAVYPAASLVHEVPVGTPMYVVDPAAPEIRRPGVITYREKAGDRLPKLVRELLDLL
ncbi:MAG: NAD-dependent deacylase [Deltaproteobacteria bacterium]|nr:NAD-dependent deacylase [Deltaproteobacteria bacterium]